MTAKRPPTGGGPGYSALILERRRPGEARALLAALPTNLSRPEIASELSVSLNTVGTHLRSIYAKLQVRDRSSAVRRARELRLLAAGRSALAPLDEKADHVRGSPAGPLILEYGDYECPHSRQAFHSIEQVERRLGGRERYRACAGGHVRRRPGGRVR